MKAVRRYPFDVHAFPNGSFSCILGNAESTLGHYEYTCISSLQTHYGKYFKSE